MRLLAILLLALAAQGLDRSWTEEYPLEAAAANKACAAKDWQGCQPHLLRLLELLDGRADIVYRLARLEASLNHREAALQWLSRFSKSELTFADPATDAELATLKNDPGFADIAARIQKAREPVSSSKTFLAIPEKDLLTEDLAYDSSTARFFVSSVRHGKVVVIDKSGKVADFVPERPDAWAMMALAADSKKRLLWATTVAMPERLGFRKDDDGKSAVLKFSLDSGALLKRYDTPNDGKHALGDMTISASGDVYVSDGLGIVYRIDHLKDTLETLIGPGTFRSPQTPALSADGRTLFVPDYSRGISAIDLATKQLKLLEHPPELSLGGIDGLYLSGTTMFAIQNGTAPERLIRMQLDPKLARILSWETLESNWPGLGDPTHGVVVGRQFYFIANSGWDRLRDDGALKPGAEFDPALIRQMALTAKPGPQR